MSPIFKKGKTTTSNDQIQLSIAPNPSNGLINIQLSLPAPSDVSADIYDLAGKKIRAIVLPTKFQEGIYNIKADLTDLSAGIYFIESRVGGKIYKNKVVKN